jgi:hypothetical protein
MKQKRVDRVERRRPQVEVNLMSDGGARQSIAQRGRGCLSFLTPSLFVLAALEAHVLGLV